MGMELHYAAVLGLVQGLTEFLPVSSSGHLVLFQNLFGLEEPALFFDVSLHVGTLLAICVFFYRDLKAIFIALFSGSTWSAGSGGLWERLCRHRETRFAGLILLGTIPTCLIGLLVKPMAERIFSSIFIVGVMLLVTGTLLWFTRHTRKEGRNDGRMIVWDALLIGTIQGAAIFPGLSRSGATIAVGLFAGLDRETAARFSFLLAIPAIIGAMILQLSDAFSAGFPPATAVLTGTFAAAGVGYAALSILMPLVKRGDLYAFAPYCWLLGTVALVSSF